MGSNIDVDFVKIAVRAKNIILRPRREWEEIAAEQTTVKKLYCEYFIPLFVITHSIWAFTLEATSLSGVNLPEIIIVVIFYTLLGCALVALTSSLASFLTKENGGQERVQRYKLVIYASTAYCLSKTFLPVMSDAADRILLDSHESVFDMIAYFRLVLHVILKATPLYILIYTVYQIRLGVPRLTGGSPSKIALVVVLTASIIGLAFALFMMAMAMSGA